MNCPPEHHPVEVCKKDMTSLFWGLNLLSHNWSEPYLCPTKKWESDGHAYECVCLNCGAFIISHISENGMVFAEWATSTESKSWKNCEETVMKQALE